MLTAQENALLTEVGPDKPMGKLLRRFWIPALLADALPGPDCDPVRVRLVGEDFVAFRDSTGAVGFFDEACCHRGASLALGRVEECGIRCIYHGWKFAVDGTILETPNVRGDTVKRKLRAPAYPAREAGGLVWVYLGPPEHEPPLPQYAFMTVPDEQRALMRVELDCNWMQVLEAGVDSSHVGILHADHHPFERTGGEFEQALHPELDDFESDDNAPVIEVENTDFGFHYAALREPRRPRTPGDKYVRVHNFVMPFSTMIPPHFHQFCVPVDDAHTVYVWCLSHPSDPVDVGVLHAMSGRNLPGVWTGDHVDASAENRWLQDRSKMDESFSGIVGGGLNLEDFAMQLAMGTSVNRSAEHLVPADVAVIRTRRLLLKALRDVDAGERPGPWAGADAGSIQTGEGVVPEGTPWQTLVPGNRAVADQPRATRPTAAE